MESIKLGLPLKQIFVTQPFAVNYVNYYQQWGLNGHNGTDFRADIGTECYSVCDGEVTYAGMDGDGGISITVVNKEFHFKIIYYHLSKVMVKVGDKVKMGDLICLTGNTGKYTTGPHLHLGMKFLDDNNFNTLNYNNGFKGAIDLSIYFGFRYNGKPMANSDWEKSRCYHRYDRGRPDGGWENELRIVEELTPYLKRLPNNEEINACTYGGWHREVLKDITMYIVYSQLKKVEYEAGEKFN